NTAAAAISGGSSTAYVSGPLARNLPASLSSGSTYVFPVGKSGSGYYPLTLNNPTTGAGTILLTAEAFASGAGGSGGTGIYSISTTEYWRLQSTGNFTNSSYSLTRPSSVSPFTVIGRSTTLAGAYDTYGGTVSGSSINTSSTITGAADQYFAFGTVPVLTLSSSSLAAFGNVCINTSSSEQSFTVSGSYLKSAITLTPPTGFEISTGTGGSFAPTSSITLSPTSGTVNTTTIYVRFKPTLVQAYSDNITSATTSVTTVNIAVTGTGVTTPAQPGSITGSASVCSSTAGLTYSISSVANATSYTWTVPTGWSVTAGTNTNSITVTSGSAGQSGNITVTANNSCGSSSSQTLAVTVVSSVGGTATPGSASVCLNASTTITLTGNTGTIQWQRSENAGSSWSNISGATSSTYTTSNLIVDTRYRAVVVNGSCASANSSEATVAIAEANQSNAGASTYNSAWSNSQNDNTTGMGAWSLSATGTAGFFTGSSDVNNANSRSWGMYASGGSNLASAIRTVSMSIGNKLSFSMDNGSIDATKTIGFGLQNASGENLMELVFIGGQFFYQILDQAGTTNTSIGFTSGGLDVTVVYSGVNTYEIYITGKGGTTVSYTARTFSARSGGQVPAQIRFFNAGAGTGGAYDLFFNSLSLSNPIVTAQPSTSTQTICINGSATALSVTASGTGLSYQWYSNASNSNSGGSLIDGATAASYTPLTTTAGTLYYYCVVSNASCGSATSRPSGAITINAASVGGTASSNQTICTGTAPNDLTLSGNTGTIQWQVSTDNATFNNISGATSATLTSAQMGSLSGVRYYRAAVTNSPCTVAYSNTVTISITSSVGGEVTPSTASVCLGTSIQLEVVNNTGASFQWQRSTDGTNWFNISGATTNPYTTSPPNTVTTYYRASVTNGSCAANTSTPATISIQDVNESTAAATAYNGSPGWDNNDNDNVTGLGAWTLSSSGTAGFFTGSSLGNDGGTSPLPSINSSSRAWGLFANSGGLASAVRTISGNLSVGQTISFSMDNGSVNNGATVGFALQNVSGNALMELYFVGGASTYTISDNGGTLNSTI
ncbi:MAG: hypothetical protein ACOVP6_01000, partial [Lacibacter sp.]